MTRRKISGSILCRIAVMIAVPFFVAIFYGIPMFSLVWWILSAGGELLVVVYIVGMKFGEQKNKFWT